MRSHELMPLRLLAHHLDRRFGLGLNTQTHQIIDVGDDTVRRLGKDRTHDKWHHFHIGAQFGRVLNHNPNLHRNIDPNAFWRVLALHDIPVALSNERLHNFIPNQFFEHIFADSPARRLMKHRGFPDKEIQQVAGLIRNHPHHPDSPAWKRWAETVDVTTQMTSRVFYWCDTADIYRPTRIRQMVAMVEDMIGPTLTTLFSRKIHEYAITRGDITVDIPGFPWFANELERRKQRARSFVDRLFEERQKLQQ